MPKSYETGHPEDYDLLHQVICEHHPNLAERKIRCGIVRVGAALNKNGDATGPALKLLGSPCIAIIKLVPIKDRVHKGMDVEIQLSENEWDKVNEKVKLATLDHEVSHLEILRDRNGAAKTEDDGITQLRIKRHDFLIGGFHDVIERHGQSAVELDSMQTVVHILWNKDQAYFPFMGAEIGGKKPKAGKEKTATKKRSGRRGMIKT